MIAVAARQLPNDWQSRYGCRPVQLKTFVESERHRGTCYKAANWIPVGKTAGRGKKCPTHNTDRPHQRYLAVFAAPGLRSRAVLIGNGYGFTECVRRHRRPPLGGLPPWARHNG